MQHQASAHFDNLSHEPTPIDEGPPSRARLAVRRRWSGDLAGESTGDLLACFVGPEDFAYVGMDAFEGELAGRRGRFVFQHGQHRAGDGVETFGYVVPGSASGALAGLTGELRIAPTPDGRHAVTMRYELPD